MSDWSSRRERYRGLLAGDQCVCPASVFDPMSLRIAESLGFELGMFAGSVASLTILGAPDDILITLTEFAGQALRINRAGELPVMVDADHGYGNALNAMRTVTELDFAGVAGLSIEDTVLPRPFGSAGKAALIPIEEGIGKMRAAIAGRRDPALVIAGRTSAPAIAGLAETITRLKAYEATGVDALFVVGLKTRADLDVIAAAVHKPLILGGSAGELADRAYLASRGVRVALQGHQPIHAAVRAVHATMKALREGTPPAEIAGLADVELMGTATRAADYARWTKSFL